MSERSIRPIFSQASFRGQKTRLGDALGATFARSVLPSLTRDVALERIAGSRSRELRGSRRAIGVMTPVWTIQRPAEPEGR